MQEPVLSIITPLYNRGWCVADCIESIGLGDPAAELIIVDDGSRDDSVLRVRQTVERLGLGDRVRLIEQPNAGPSTARNRAAAEARGEWLVFLDSDDLWLPWTLPALHKILPQAGRAVDLTFLQGQNFADPTELAGLQPQAAVMQRHPCFVEAVRTVPTLRYGACNAAIRKEVFDRLGGFPADLRCMEDTDLFLRVPGEVMTISAPVLAGLRRSGHESLSGNAAEVARGFQWLSDKNRQGGYVGTLEARRRFLAGSCAYAIRTAFGAGQPGRAYGLYLKNIGLLMNRRTHRHLVRLPLTPLLHLYKPAAYPFRWRPG